MKVTIIGGFLGSGKTTTILKLGRRLSDSGKRIAIIVNEIGEIGDTILGRHLPDWLVTWIVPIKILGDIVGGDGEGKDTPFGVPFHHHLGKGPVDQIHFRLKMTLTEACIVVDFLVPMTGSAWMIYASSRQTS